MSIEQALKHPFIEQKEANKNKTLAYLDQVEAAFDKKKRLKELGYVRKRRRKQSAAVSGECSKIERSERKRKCRRFTRGSKN
jgi:hypothetical protein